MTGANQVSIEPWTTARASSLAAGCLLVGIAGGWLLRGVHPVSIPPSATPANLSSPANSDSAFAVIKPSSAAVKKMADAKAAQLLDQLKENPANPDLLTSLGNLYYDSQQYAIAVGFYGRVLKIAPTDADVRTDMATAYWYMGDADTAIAEFNKALSYQPDRPNTLFNRGLVKWHGKQDIAGAVADWERLLKANPDYVEKHKVEQSIAEAKSDTTSQQK